MSKKKLTPVLKVGAHIVNPVEIKRLDHVAGFGPSEHNTEGTSLDATVVVARNTVVPGRFSLCMKLGDRWYDTRITVPVGDPAIEALKAQDNWVSVGKSPQQIARDEKREAAEQERLSMERYQKEARHQEKIRAREKAEAKAAARAAL